MTPSLPPSLASVGTPFSIIGRYRMQRSTVGLLLATALLSTPSPAWAQQNTPVPAGPAAAASPSSGPLLPGDALRIASWREAELRGDFPVDEAGIVSLPLLGEWKVAGVPVAELKRQILAAYSDQLRNQQIQLTPLRRVSVLGAVRTPGVYLIDATVGLPQVLALAGGATREGTLKGIQIRRGSQVFQLSAESTQPDHQLTSGDQITVPERSWLARNGQFVVAGALSVAAILLARAF